MILFSHTILPATKKQLRLKQFDKLLQYLDTPPSLITEIIQRIQTLYNSQRINIDKMIITQSTCYEEWSELISVIEE